MKVKIYGAANCITCLKAKVWLETNRLPYDFIDLDKTSLSQEEAEELCSFKEADPEHLFATWSEAFPQELEENLSCLDKKQIVKLCSEHSKALRRPIIIIDEVLFVGYDERLLAKIVMNERNK